MSGKTCPVMILVMIIALSSSVWGQSPFEDGIREAETLIPVVVLDFLILDETGVFQDPSLLNQGEYLNLSRSLAQGVMARLLQYGSYNVLDLEVMAREYDMGMEELQGMGLYEMSRHILDRYPVQEVITGTMTPLQTITVLTLQRFGVREGRVQRLGSAMVLAPRISEAPTMVDELLQDVYLPPEQVVESPIEQIFVVPGQLRINLGSSHELSVFALDNRGRLIADPSFLFFSADERKVFVNEKGVVKALQPGTTTITVRGLTRTARSGPPTTISVTVLPPALGIRIGALLTDKEGIEGIPFRFGLRFTPSIDAASAPDVPEFSTDSTNPLAIVSSFFGSLLTSGIMTFDLDFDPNKELLFALSGVQRSSSGYVGTGVGYSTPLAEDEEAGFVLRFTAGTQYQFSSRLSFPAEVVMDMIFATTELSTPAFRLGINLGLDLFP